jgi:homocysteine S-methyltransferase
VRVSLAKQHCAASQSGDQEDCAAAWCLIRPRQAHSGHAGLVAAARPAPAGRRAAAERAEALAEQVRALAAAGADLIMLETFGYLDELAEAVTVANSVCTLPLVAQATFAEDGRTAGR